MGEEGADPPAFNVGIVGGSGAVSIPSNGKGI